MLWRLLLLLALVYRCGVNHDRAVGESEPIVPRVCACNDGSRRHTPVECDDDHARVVRRKPFNDLPCGNEVAAAAVNEDSKRLLVVLRSFDRSTNVLCGLGCDPALYAR